MTRIHVRLEEFTSNISFTRGVVVWWENGKIPGGLLAS